MQRLEEVWLNFAMNFLALGDVEKINVVCALLAAAVAFASLNKMNGLPDKAVRCGIVTFAAGLLGAAIGTVNHWRPIFDTVLLGGALAMLLGSRRGPGFLDANMRAGLSLVVTTGSWLLFLWRA